MHKKDKIKSTFITWTIIRIEQMQYANAIHLGEMIHLSECRRAGVVCKSE
jgi:hypothetical protein